MARVSYYLLYSFLRFLFEDSDNDEFAGQGMELDDAEDSDSNDDKCVSLP